MEPLTAPPLTPELEAVARAHELFRELDDRAFADLSPELQPLALRQGMTLFHAGDEGDSLYVVVRGRLAVRVKEADGTEQVIAELGPGETVGEMALLTGLPRTATVSAVEDAQLVRLTRAGFDRLASDRPAAVAQFARTVLPRFRQTYLLPILTPLFGPLGAAALHDLQTQCEWRRLSVGENLFRQGDRGDALYIVLNGRLRVSVTDAQGLERVIGEVGRGETVGEQALLTGEARSANAYAVRNTELVKLSDKAFWSLLERYPRMALELSRLIVRRLDRANRGMLSPSPAAAAYALVPVDADIPLSQLARQLVEALALDGPTLHLSSERLDAYLGRPGVAQTPQAHPTDIAISGWLSDLERQYRYVVYEADRTLTAWTQRCLRQADRILLAARAEADPTPGQFEGELLRFNALALRELVLVHPDGTRRPQGTLHWLAPRQVYAHHHVRLGSGQDLRRLARRLTGRMVGLVLGGGGARGYAHIGVIRALEEANLEVDCVGGTSMGSLIAAGYALGMDYEAMVKMASRFGSAKQLFDYTLPTVAFFKSQKVTRMLWTLFGEAQIEDLWRSFFCVSSNLTHARPVVHQLGPLWRAVRASISIAGVYTPIVDGGDVLADGGYLNNLPIDVMRELIQNGTVIAVDVSPEHEAAHSYDFGPSLSGWYVLWRRLNPFTPSLPAPSLFATMLRVGEISSAYHLANNQRLADLVISPPVEQFPSLDFSRYEPIIQIGYEAARREIETHLAELQAKAAPAVRSTP